MGVDILNKGACIMSHEQRMSNVTSSPQPPEHTPPWAVHAPAHAPQVPEQEHVDRDGSTPEPGISRKKVALIMAGGTGGHIFPGLAVADALRAQGWVVHWLGAPNSMESRIVPAHDYPLELVDFSGVRGKGLHAMASLPVGLTKACWQAYEVVRRIEPDVVIGFGGYMSFPGGLVAAVSSTPLIVHEQNAVAGMANKLLSFLADRVFTAFPRVLAKGAWIGNPLRAAFLQQALPEERFAGRSGPLRLLVVGGSLGARALNELVPQALALLPPDQYPVVIHQSGEAHIQALQMHYEKCGISATLLPFIDDMASAMADADLIICRAGASTVTEIAAIGAAALLVPFPSAVDDHQTHNARFLVDAGGAWMLQQSDLTPDVLAKTLLKLDRPTLVDIAQKAKNMQKINAAREIVSTCEGLAG